jgi:hypothetical protein
MPLNARTFLTAMLLLTGALALAACGGSSPARTVPAAAAPSGTATSVAGSTTGGATGAKGDGAGKGNAPSLLRAGTPAAIHAAADCIRTHGVPGFPDPVVDSSGHAYSDTRSIERAPDAVRQAIDHACSTLLATAGVDPTKQPPAPIALVRAGVVAARCVRAHGMPNRHDPNTESPYTPGHGFGLSENEVPAGGKLSAGFKEARQACGAELDAEVRASTLTSLAGG